MPRSMSESSNPVDLAAEIVSAFVTHNSLRSADLPALIESVHAGLVKIANGAAHSEEPPAPTAAVTIRKSVTPDYLICLDDGRKFKSLRRHLLVLGMTPEQYRAKWKLPADYPMVAANYAAQRSAMAKQMGLGHMGKGGAGRKRKAGRLRKATV